MRTSARTVDALAFVERPRRHEARAVALRVGEQPAGVRAALRSAHEHVAERARRDAEEADLRLRA